MLSSDSRDAFVEQVVTDARMVRREALPVDFLGAPEERFGVGELATGDHQHSGLLERVRETHLNLAGIP
jgi:hypothetical protein